MSRGVSRVPLISIHDLKWSIGATGTFLRGNRFVILGANRFDEIIKLGRAIEHAQEMRHLGDHAKRLWRTCGHVVDLPAETKTSREP
jgi:hypothetical protein